MAIEQFNAQALLSEQPLGELSDVFVPVYFMTRYQIDAAANGLAAVIIVINSKALLSDGIICRLNYNAVH